MRLAHGAIAATGMCIAAAALTGCASMSATGAMTRTAAMHAADWHEVASEADRLRIRDWWGAWSEALADARSKGFADAIAAEGALLEPNAALENPAMLLGDFRCRVIKLGAGAGGSRSYSADAGGLCRIANEGAVLSFVKLDGMQRPSGFIYSDDDHRLIFLGSLAMGDERRALDYGADTHRNLAGLVERIGPRHWRIVLPRPSFESILDVIDLVPVDGAGNS